MIYVKSSTLLSFLTVGQMRNLNNGIYYTKKQNCGHFIRLFH